MWRDALRVCQRHLPHLAHKVHAQYQVRGGGEKLFAVLMPGMLSVQQQFMVAVDG